MKTKATRPPYVYRVKHPATGTDGYLAKVVRGTHRLQKVFSLSEFDGNHAKARNAAGRAAAAFAKAHPRMSRRAVAQLPRRKKDTTLPVGVRLVRNRVKGRVYEFYEAAWSPEPNQQVKKRFSVNVHGRKEALRLALATRKRGLSQMSG